ncbi:MAG: hypothetical protein H6Q78_1189, partial [Candidatus Krumholzibacteriota bacterium]|nr:hypothetical protein [Candidatus Krumholzibacteriota bacterium]
MVETIRTDMADDTRGKEPRGARRGFRRALRWIGLAAAGVLVLALVIVAAALLPPIRVRILAAALNRADAALPGEVRVEKVAWPSLGSIDVSGVSWTDAADTLLAVDHAGVSVSIFSLFKKDMRVHRLVADGLLVDVPGITSRVASKGKQPRPPERNETRAFPRRGSIPGVPSIGVERVHATVRSIRWGASEEIHGAMLSGGFDAVYGDVPWIRVDTLSVRGPEDTWRIDDLALRVDPTNGVFDGSGHGALSPRWPLRFAITPVSKDRFTLAVAPENTAASRDSIGLTADISLLGREGIAFLGMDFWARIRTPGTKELAQEPSLASRFEGVPELAGLTLSLEGQLLF